MRFILPTALAAVALMAGSAPAPAQGLGHRPPKRARSHVSLHVSAHDVLAGRSLRLRGRVRPRGAHRVKIVVRGAGRASIAVRTHAGGSFSRRWRPRGIGSYEIRAYGLHDRRVRGSIGPGRRVTAYRTADASYYGPGLYGGALACGGTLQPGTLGVASLTLPCGARVRLRYRGRSVIVPVVDRGPYVGGREFDLTAATRARLRFPTTGVLLSSR